MYLYETYPYVWKNLLRPNLRYIANNEDTFFVEPPEVFLERVKEMLTREAYIEIEQAYRELLKGVA